MCDGRDRTPLIRGRQLSRKEGRKIDRKMIDSTRDFIDWLSVEAGLAENTRLAYEADLARFTAWLAERGVHRPGQVKGSHVARYLESRGDVSARTRARNLAAIRMLFRFLVAEGRLTMSPVDAIDRPLMFKRLPGVLSPEQVERLLESADPATPLGRRDRALLEVLYATGARASEVSGLRVVDVDLSVACARCFGKGAKERIVPLGSKAVAALNAWLLSREALAPGRKLPDRVFVSCRGTPLARRDIWSRVRLLARRAGITQRVYPHMLRHSFATHMLANGADLRYVQEFLGHATISTTQIYTHVDRSKLRRIHERFHPRA